MGLESIFKMAQSEGFVPFNPAAALFTPPGKPEGEKLVMAPAEIRQRWAHSSHTNG